MNRLRSTVIALALILASVSMLRAETGAEGWLRYAPIARETAAADNAIPSAVVAFGDSKVLNSAKGELIRGIESMLGKQLHAEQNVSSQNAFVLGLSLIHI